MAINWRFWQKQKSAELPSVQKVLASPIELEVREELQIPKEELEQLHRTIESIGRGNRIYQIMWSASKIPEKTASTLTPNDLISYPAAALEILYTADKNDTTAKKTKLGKMVDALAFLSKPEDVANEKTRKATLTNLRAFINQGRRVEKDEVKERPLGPSRSPTRLN